MVKDNAAEKEKFIEEAFPGMTVVPYLFTQHIEELHLKLKCPRGDYSKVYERVSQNSGSERFIPEWVIEYLHRGDSRTVPEKIFQAAKHANINTMPLEEKVQEPDSPFRRSNTDSEVAVNRLIGAIDSGNHNKGVQKALREVEEISDAATQPDPTTYVPKPESDPLMESVKVSQELNGGQPYTPPTPAKKKTKRKAKKKAKKTKRKTAKEDAIQKTEEWKKRQEAAAQEDPVTPHPKTEQEKQARKAAARKKADNVQKKITTKPKTLMEDKKAAALVDNYKGRDAVDVREQKRKKDDKYISRIERAVWQKATARYYQEHPRGYVPRFAAKALVDRLIDEEAYASVEELDKKVAKRFSRKRGTIISLYTDQDDRCEDRLYELLVRLVKGHDTGGDEELTNHQKYVMKNPQKFEPSRQYMTGQLVLFERNVAVVTEELENGDIRLVFDDDEKLTYVQGMLHRREEDKQ